MAEGKAGIGDLIRKIISSILLVAAVLALIGLCIGGGTTIIQPFADAFSPFDFGLLGQAIYNLMNYLSVPLIMIMLGLIGLTVDY